MDISPEPQADPGLLKFLKILVTTLAATMIIGLIVLIGLIVMRFSAEGQVAIPDALTIPEGAQVVSFTRGPDWVAVVTDQNQILIFGARTGNLRQTVEIRTPQE